MTGNLQFILCKSCGTLKLVGMYGLEFRIHPNSGAEVTGKPLKKTIECPDCGFVCEIETSESVEKDENEHE